MEKISSDGRVEMMCSVVAVFIMAFVVFYMFYSNNFFMRRRMKELGIYALLGYRKGSMLCLLTIENIFVCLGGTIVGILAGSLLHISVTAGIVALLGLTIDMGAIPFINPQAVSSIFLFILAVLLTLSGEEVRTPGFECMSLTDYNALLNSQGKESSISELGDAECVLVKYRPDPENSDIGAVYHLNIGDGTKTDVTVVQTTLDNPIGFANSVATLLVSDQLYQTIASGQPEQITVVSINGGTTRSDGTAYTILKDAMPENIYLASAWQRQTEIIQLNSSTYLLIAFATIIFLIATGSILYFQNLSAVTYDRDDYNILQRMGYNRNMIKRCVRRQIQIYFVIPYMMGMLHSIFAIICYKSALMDDVLGQAGEVILPVALAVGIFSTVYFIYYQVTKYSCYKAVIN